MKSYIESIKDELRQKHYIRKVRKENYWYDFSSKKIEEYNKNEGEDFCLVLYSSSEIDDAYVIPFVYVKPVFTRELIDDRGRWTGTINNDVLGVHCNPAEPKFLIVSSFYNAYDLLGNFDGKDEGIDDYLVVDSDREENELQILKEKIIVFNNCFRDVTPYKRLILSEQIARPGSIANYLKKLLNFRCQLCGILGFKKKNGSKYIESHHIYELHELIPGSYCSDNIIIVCPTCHKKIHYAKVLFEICEDNVFKININGNNYDVERNMLSKL